MKDLIKLVSDLESNISNNEKVNTSVSQSNVGWQIEHSCKVISNIIDVLKNSNPEDYKWQFNFTRLYILTIGFIPRGKGKAPKSVHPEGEISSTTLQNSVKNVREKIKEWENLPANSFFKHPYFGPLNKHKTKRFLVIHTKHHLKIIDDICSKE